MSRAGRAWELAATEGLDGLIVADLVNPGDSGREARADVFWLTGFTGTSGFCLLTAERRLFMTDFRYTERAAREVDPEFERVTAGAQPLVDLAAELAGRVGYDAARTSVRTLRRLDGEVGEGVELVAVNDLIGRLRRRKDAEEVGRIAAAAALADEAYDWICERGLAGRTERDVQLAAEQRMRELGAQDPAFPTIVAAGENAALPHHEASAREIGAAELVIVDMGAILDGYCSDCTRTFATGEPSTEQAELYELVRATQAAALKAVGPGVSCKDADSASRGPIAEAGYAEHYGHGLGHGVGIEVHEAPRLSQRSEDTLEEGDVVTVEPGVYLPGRMGVRIEDLVTITADGHRNLSSVPKDVRIVG